MSPEIITLTLSAAVIAMVHTLLGPDHYLPFLVMAKARGWSALKTLKITLFCGLAHLLGSVALGFLGITLGTQLASLEWLEGVRGNLAAWMLIGLGVAYTAWGLRRAIRNRPHCHWHEHDGTTHRHLHDHHHSHAHVHVHDDRQTNLMPWIIFIIFVLGPCEPLIPLLMYPAARESMLGVVMVTTVFGLVTVLTMTLVVSVSLIGLKSVKLKRLERFSHAMAGGTILLCGLGIAFLGV